MPPCQNGRRGGGGGGGGGGQFSLAGCTLDGSYPTGYSEDQKRSFRRKTKLNFSSQIWCRYIMHASSVSAEERRWRRVITAEEERHRVITTLTVMHLLKVRIVVICSVYVGAG